MKISRAKRQINYRYVGNNWTRSAEHSLRSQVGMGSESDCLLGQLNRILEISDSEAGLKADEKRSANAYVVRYCRVGYTIP